MQVPVYADFFSINTYSTANVFSLPYDLINKICFSLAYCIIGIQYIVQVTYKICVNKLYVISKAYR